MQSSNTAHVWLRIYGLSQEYWRPKILFAIANSVGTPICTDSASSKPMIDRTFGQFVRILVDMDVTQTLRYKVLVERVGFAFYVDLEYENLPDYCTNCKKIGHYLEICKNLHSEPIHTENIPNKSFNKEPRQLYIKKKDGRKEQGKVVENPIILDQTGKINVEDVVGKLPREPSTSNLPSPILNPVT